MSSRRRVAGASRSYTDSTGGVLAITRKASPLDMGRMVRFEKERPRAHRVYPLIRQARSIKEPAGALNLCEGRCDCVRNGEARNESHAAHIPPSYTDTTVSASPAARAFM